MKHLVKMSFLAIFTLMVGLLIANTIFATPTKQAANSMHYGMPTASAKTVQGFGSIVITNCSYQMADVSAWFVDGSFKFMPIYPVTRYPENMISIDNPFPFVDIQVAAFDGTVLFPEQAVYPGQHVNIGCGETLSASSHVKPTVTIS